MEGCGGYWGIVDWPRVGIVVGWREGRGNCGGLRGGVWRGYDLEVLEGYVRFWGGLRGTRWFGGVCVGVLCHGDRLHMCVSMVSV